MRMKRWVIYDTTTGIFPLTIVARFRNRRAGEKLLKGLLKAGDCVYLAYIAHKHAKPYTAERERPIDRAFRHKFGTREPILAHQ